MFHLENLSSECKSLMLFLVGDNGNGMNETRAKHWRLGGRLEKNKWIQIFYDDNYEENEYGGEWSIPS